MYTDLREWLDQAHEFGLVHNINEADWNLELGALTELMQRQGQTVPVLLFDHIQGYPGGYRVCTNLFGDLKMLVYTAGLSGINTSGEFVYTWKDKWGKMEPIPPRFVNDGPVMENVFTGNQVDLFKFPVPFWHEHDGGRYIGTASVTITRDPDDGWINLGTYRVMAHDKQTLAFYVSPGHHGRIHRDKYFAQNKPCPVAISLGQDPLLFLVASNPFPYGVSEYDYAGALKGSPIEIIKGPTTGLPIPAHAEIVIEGEAWPGEYIQEGPFGEWTGYYGSDTRPEPIIRVKSVMHRNNPILCGSPPLRPPHAENKVRGLMQAGMIWRQIEMAGVPDVTGVRLHEAGKLFLLIISLKQRYPGHARQAALVASQCGAGAYMGRYIVVVDDDIDIWDTDQVIWAICTRTDPKQSIQILDRCWSGPLDPIIEKDKKGFSSRAIIDACRPWERKETFPRVVEISSSLKQKVMAKWSSHFENKS